MLGAFAITIAGWFAWQGFLDGAYARKPSPYAARGGFSHTFGPDGLWWLTALAIVAALIVIETAYKAVKHRLVVAGLWRFPPWRRKARYGRNNDNDDDDDTNEKAIKVPPFTFFGERRTPEPPTRPLLLSSALLSCSVSPLSAHHNTHTHMRVDYL